MSLCSSPPKRPCRCLGVPPAASLRPYLMRRHPDHGCRAPSLWSRPPPSSRVYAIVTSCALSLQSRSAIVLDVCLLTVVGRCSPHHRLTLSPLWRLCHSLVLAAPPGPSTSTRAPPGHIPGCTLLPWLPVYSSESHLPRQTCPAQPQQPLFCRALARSSMHARMCAIASNLVVSADFTLFVIFLIWIASTVIVQPLPQPSLDDPSPLRALGSFS